MPDDYFSLLLLLLAKTGQLQNLLIHRWLSYSLEFLRSIKNCTSTNGVKIWLKFVFYLNLFFPDGYFYPLSLDGKLLANNIWFMIWWEIEPQYLEWKFVSFYSRYCKLFVTLERKKRTKQKIFNLVRLMHLSCLEDEWPLEQRHLWPMTDK